MSAPLDRDLWRAALIAALVLTLANAVKPLVIDDTVYVTMARHVVEHPADPYGFELYWYDAPEPAMRVGTLAPVLPYWLAGAMALFGDHPFAWKLSLFPFALALTGSIAFLLLRFARPLAIPVLYTLVLGPTVLPGMSLMLDFPALALGLLGFALFVRACEQERWRLAFGAGLVVGLAMQTKYSGVLYPALVLAYGVLYRRARYSSVGRAGSRCAMGSRISSRASRGWATSTPPTPWTRGPASMPCAIGRRAWSRSSVARQLMRACSRWQGSARDAPSCCCRESRRSSCSHCSL
jgi:hypothetical protein